MTEKDNPKPTMLSEAGSALRRGIRKGSYDVLMPREMMNIAIEVAWLCKAVPPRMRTAPMKIPCRRPRLSLTSGANGRAKNALMFWTLFMMPRRIDTEN